MGVVFFKLGGLSLEHYDFHKSARTRSLHVSFFSFPVVLFAMSECSQAK